MSDEPLPIPEHSAQEARDKIAEILSRKEFRPRQKSIFEHFGDWLSDTMGDLFRPISGPSIGDYSLLDGVAIVVLVAVVVIVVVRLTRTMRSGARVRSDPSAPTPERRTGRAWRLEAEEHESAGAWRQALRCRYRALLVELVNRRVVGDVPGRTAGEYRMEAQHRLPLLEEPFKGATELFESAWYGNASVGLDESRRFQELADQIAAVVSSGSGSGRDGFGDGVRDEASDQGERAMP